MAQVAQQLPSKCKALSSNLCNKERERKITHITTTTNPNGKILSPNFLDSYDLLLSNP
jgi:hypothetical protein